MPAPEGSVKCARRKGEMGSWGRAPVALADLLKLAPPILYGVALLAAFLESAPAVGLLVPGQTILFGAGFLSGQGRLDPFLLVGLVCIGGFSGDTLGFVLGRRWGVGPLQRLPGRLRLTAGGRARLTALFSSHGAKSVILARFQPLGRAFGPYLAGATGMPAGRFLAADALASVLAAGSLVALGYLAGLGFERLSRTIGLTAVIVVSILLIIVVAVGLRIKHQKEHLQDDLEQAA